MANNRDSSKQKRARQNRAQREAREARAAAASLPAEERKAKYASSTPSEPASAKKARGADRPRPERRPRPGDLPVDIDTLEGSWISKRMQVPGGRQVIFGAVLAVLVSGMTLFAKYPDPDATGKNKDDLVLTFSEAFKGLGFALVAATLIALAVATWFILSPNRRRIWIGCSIVAGLASVVLGLSFIFPVGFLVYAVMRSNKIEGPSPTSRAGREAAAAEAEADAPAEDDDPEDE